MSKSQINENYKVQKIIPFALCDISMNRSPDNSDREVFWFTQQVTSLPNLHLFLILCHDLYSQSHILLRAKIKPSCSPGLRSDQKTSFV